MDQFHSIKLSATQAWSSGYRYSYCSHTGTKVGKHAFLVTLSGCSFALRVTFTCDLIRSRIVQDIYMTDYKGRVSGVLPALVALNIRSSCPVCVRYGVFLVRCNRCSLSLFSHQDLGYPFVVSSVCIVVALCANSSPVVEYCTHFFARAGTRDCRVALAFGECASGYLISCWPGLRVCWSCILFFIEMSMCPESGCVCSMASRVGR